MYDKEYPSLLKEINNPPLLLYCKGNIQLLNTECVGIVGTRKPTDYGKLETRIFYKKVSGKRSNNSEWNEYGCGCYCSCNYT